jgi:hypothetical protein
MKKNTTNIIKTPISITEYNRKNNIKNLKILLNSVLDSKKDAETLYLLNLNYGPDEMYFRHFLFLQGEKAIYLWTHGFITNFSEVLKRYVPDRDNILQTNIFDIKWSQIDSIFLTKVPGKNSSMLKELTLLKQTLNIKVIAFVDINNEDETSLCKSNILTKNHTTFIDVPLYYSNDPKKNNTVVSKELLYQITLKTLGMKQGYDAVKGYTK